MTKQRLVTSALIIKEDTILLVQNRKDPDKAFGFPGGIGAWEDTSDPKGAVIREVRGDVGCEFSGEFFTYAFRDEETPVITLFFVGSIEGDPIPVCKDIVDVKWFPIEEARRMKLTFEHNTILEKYLKTILTVPREQALREERQRRAI